jgi:hypothetical protein
MRTLGINYDTGLVLDGGSTRTTFDEATVRRELEIIAGDLHATAVRVTGDRVDRLELAARHAGKSSCPGPIWMAAAAGSATAGSTWPMPPPATAPKG